MVFVTSRLCGRLGQIVCARKIVRWLTLTFNISKTVLNIKNCIMYQVFMLDMLSFEFKLILRVSSPLNGSHTVDSFDNAKH